MPKFPTGIVFDLNDDLQKIENLDHKKKEVQTNSKKKKLEVMTIDQQASIFEKWLRANLEEEKKLIYTKAVGITT